MKSKIILSFCFIFLFFVSIFSDTLNITELSRLKLPGRVRGICLHENLLAAAHGPTGVSLIDIGKEKILSTFQDSLRKNARNVEIRQNYAYIVEDNFGMIVVDITDHSKPTLIKSIPCISSYDPDLVRIHDTLAFVTRLAGGVEIYNISDPVPVLTKYMQFIGVDCYWARDFVFKDNKVFEVCDNNANGGLRIVDASNPYSPQIDTSISIDDIPATRVDGIALIDSIVYLSGVHYLYPFRISSQNKIIKLKSIYVNYYGRYSLRSYNRMIFRPVEIGLQIIEVDDSGLMKANGIFQCATCDDAVGRNDTVFIAHDSIISICKINEDNTSVYNFKNKISKNTDQKTRSMKVNLLGRIENYHLDKIIHNNNKLFSITR